MKLSVSAYRAHASAHKKILDTAYQLNYGSTSASHHATSSTSASGGAALPASAAFQIDPPSGDQHGTSTTGGDGDGGGGGGGMVTGSGDQEDGSSDDANTPLQSPKSQNTSREEEDESSNANESDCKSPSQRDAERDCERLRNVGGSAKVATQSWKNLRAVMAYYNTLRKIKRTKSNQRWMKLRTTVQISSAMQKKPPLKREDSFLKRFSTRQIPETQETVEDTGSEGAPGDSQAPRRRRRLRKQPRTVVNPDENFYFYWLLILTICVLYNMWTLIVRQSFPELQQLISGFWLACDSLSDVFFILDVVVQLRTGYLEQGLMVYDSKKLAKHYLRSRAFLLDLAALSPLDLLQMRFGPQPLLRCPRFLKVYRAVNYYYMVESRTVYPNLWRVVNLIHILLILAHWFGCFYFLLSEAEGFQGDWVYPYRPGDYATLTRKYLGSLYWSTLTLTTIGDLPTPETNAEKTDSVDGPRSLPRRGVKSRLLQFNTNGGYVFTIVSYLIGVFIFATIVGQVGNVITNRNANRLEFERLLDGAKTYMRHHKVPGGMKRRVLRWYDYSWSRGRIQGGGDINTALGLLPDKLKTELALHVNLSVLKKVTIFQECQPEFLRDLVLKMKAYIFTPGDSICRKGEVAREMFIIADGILEVLSETGKVLTTMKAGDFFGEIGILNLDGLNKRTADVRSVGYSELFSLSREDVLAAMKDYPEAQEILQALGRKRLMEVKASARHSSKDHKDHHHSGTHGPDAKKLVDKIKNEAKGLRNVLRKSRTHRRSQESLELQPLNATSTNATSTTTSTAKGMLKRMSRVTSHDLSQEETVVASGEHHAEPPAPSPLGAGLPLLHRLRLLKEKQENEERERLASSAAASAMSPPVHSTSPCSLKSPAPIAEEAPPPEPHEPIGAGLPLLQRLLLLKKKEEETAPAILPTSPTSVLQTVTTTVSRNLQSTVPRLSFHPRTSITKLMQTTATAAATTTTTTAAAITTTLTTTTSSSSSAITTITTPAASSSSTSMLKTTNKLSFKERLKLHTIKDHHSSVKDSVSQPSIHHHHHPHHHHHHHHNHQQQQQPQLYQQTSESSDNNNRNEPHWSKLKKAAISCDQATTQQAKETATIDEQQQQQKEIKPKLVFTKKTKHYRSIDDLSPEYGGLPFVKKLKILNERQKLEELELVMKTRSFSLDIPEPASVESDNLTRSHSEGSKMHRDRNSGSSKNNLQLCGQLVSGSSLHSSSESNETPERRNLKSILKKLSEDTQTTTTTISAAAVAVTTTSATTAIATTITTSTTAEPCDPQELRRLMRAPTIEGYAARHSKLSKSVTFNRDTLQSPPNSANVLGTTQNLFPFVSVPTGNGVYDVTNNNNDADAEAKRQELEKCGLQFISATKNNQMKFFKGSLEEDQQYFNDILIAIKQVINSHIQEIQDKFQTRFEKLEEEVRNREDTIDKLKARIYELERTAEDSFTDSMETIIDRRQHASWEDTNLDDLKDLPKTLKPQQIWPGDNDASSPSVVLDLDSNTDPDDSDRSDSLEPGGYESGEDDIGNNWEIEMLAAQIRERRSASLDHSVGGQPAARKLFHRAGSMDRKKD